MKKLKINYLKKTFLFGIVLLMTVSCERTPSSEATSATNATTADIFTDTPIGMGTDFYFPYAPGPDNPIGSKFNAWTVDTKVGYVGTSSMRFDVPNGDDPNGNYAGGIFRVDGAGRDLTGYDALTFWAKASQNVSINEIGFGEDFYPNKYITTMRNVSITTNWVKYIIPIPDASRLVNERGMLRYAAGGTGTAKLGYTFWIDELRFEKLGTILPLQASIMNGLNVTRSTFVGVKSTVDGVSAAFNMADGRNQLVTISPAYLNFISSKPEVASVDDVGIVTPLTAGTATITATFNGQPVTGSLTINCTGAYVNAPIPTLNPANVISIFSDNYSNVPVNYYNGYWQPWQTTVSNDFSVNGDKVLNYTNFNFVGIEFSSPTVNATTMTHIHLDAFIPGVVIPGRQLRVIVVDFGADAAFGGGDDTRYSTTFTAPKLVSQNWIPIEIAFSAMPTLASRSHLAQIILEGGDNSILYVDNIYFHN